MAWKDQFIKDYQLELGSSLTYTDAETGVTTGKFIGKKNDIMVIVNNITSGDREYTVTVQESADNSTYTNNFSFVIATGLTNSQVTRKFDLRQDYIKVHFASGTSGTSGLSVSSVYLDC